MGFGNLFFQARRRRVFRTAALYVVGAWLLLQIADMAFPALSIPEESIRFVWVAESFEPATRTIMPPYPCNGQITWFSGRWVSLR